MSAAATSHLAGQDIWRFQSQREEKGVGFS